MSKRKPMPKVVRQTRALARRHARDRIYRPAPRPKSAPLTPWAEWGITPLQYQFVLAYITNRFNGGKAYREVVPTVQDNSARVQAYLWLKDPKVRACLNAKLEAAWIGLEMSATEAVCRVGAIARANMQDVLLPDGKTLRPLAEWPDYIFAAIEGFEGGDSPKVKFTDRKWALTKVLELTGKLKSPTNESLDAFALALREMLKERGHEADLDALKEDQA